MGILYYWRPDNYARDRAFGFGYHLNQNSPRLLELKPGDHVWAFTRRRTDGFYVLAADLVVAAVTFNRPGYRYGRYRVWADVDKSAYFDIDAAPDLEPLLRRMDLRIEARHLGQSFQGHAAVRVLNERDERLLAEASLYLPRLRTAGLYPEDLFEAAALWGADRAAQLVLRDEPDAVYRARHEYLYTRIDRARQASLVEHLVRLYDRRCQVCAHDPGSGTASRWSRAITSSGYRWGETTPSTTWPSSAPTTTTPSTEPGRLSTTGRSAFASPRASKSPCDSTSTSKPLGRQGAPKGIGERSGLLLVPELGDHRAT